MAQPVRSRTGGTASTAGWATRRRPAAAPLPRLAGVAFLVLVLSGAVVVALQLGPRDRGLTSGSRPALTTPPAATDSAGATTATASPSPSLSASPIGLPGAAPTNATRFNVRRTVVSIRFPLKATARYSYEDDFLVRRVGTPYAYNHARRTSAGTLQRAHDGVDILVAVGTPVLSPFDGVVIEPSVRWKPWIRSRYGIVAVVESTEPISRGYVAIMAHLSTMSVRPGTRVQRGQVLGRTGRTGNAETTRAHLHFELRAPFAIRVKIGTLIRNVDAFDPYPSLAAADPKRRAGSSAP